MKQPTDTSCFPTALAITLGIPLPGVFSYLREVDRDYPFNSQEMMVAALKLGWALIWLTKGASNVPFDEFKDDRGIIIIQTEDTLHAMAQLDKETVIDPYTGEQCSLDWDEVRHKFLLKKISVS
jgi:hypothetical protein